MKYIILFLIILSGKIFATDFTEEQRICHWYLVVPSYIKLFQNQYNNDPRVQEVNRLLQNNASSEDIVRAIKEIKPQEDFTKPHRMQIMVSVSLINIINKNNRAYYKPYTIHIANEVVRLTSEKFNLILNSNTNYRGEEPCVSNLENIANLWTEPHDRWWWNENIKPLLYLMFEVNYPELRASFDWAPMIYY